VRSHIRRCTFFVSPKNGSEGPGARVVARGSEQRTLNAQRRALLCRSSHHRNHEPSLRGLAVRTATRAPVPSLTVGMTPTAFVSSPRAPRCAPFVSPRPGVRGRELGWRRKGLLRRAISAQRRAVLCAILASKESRASLRGLATSTATRAPVPSFTVGMTPTAFVSSPRARRCAPFVSPRTGVRGLELGWRHVGLSNAR
jgi:hypothetical protein